MTALKDISTALHIIGAELASGSLKEYSTAKANFFYSKAGEDVEEWLAKINWIIETNNVTLGRRVVIVAAYLRNTAADWYEADKANITQYADRNVMSFIKQIKVKFTSDVQKD